MMNMHEVRWISGYGLDEKAKIGGKFWGTTPSKE